jgi:Rieske Fe-S protein
MIVQFPLNSRTVRTLALTVAVCVAGAGAVRAQAPAPDQQKQPAKPPAESNPFPGDTSNVPVLPSGTAPATAEPNAAPSYVPVMPSGADDPVRSPDDPVGNPDSESASGFSSSSSGTDKFVPPPDDETRRRRGGKNEPAPEHHETATEDETVGGYYLDQKNWRAAMSRFESAVVLDPENPDVYWGLAEAQRHLGQFAASKANYEKVMEYDPDSKHAKEAKKLLNSPELAKATTVAAPQP